GARHNSLVSIQLVDSNPIGSTNLLVSGPETWALHNVPKTWVTLLGRRVFEWFEHSRLQIEISQIIIHKAHCQMSWASLMPTAWPAKTVLKLIFCVPDKCDRVG